MANDTREYDVVVWGASGFTGRLVAEYLARHFGTDGALRWAMAGRSESKLEAVREQIGATGTPILIADSNDMDSLRALAGRTRVVATTVGPYARYGSQLVSACVSESTDYVDLAGEVQWIRQMIDTHQQGARDSGARIVHCCGFDSIPSDLGVLFLQNEARERHGTPCDEIKLRVKAMRGGASGGTAASLMLVVEAAREDRQIARILKNPYSLNPEGEREGLDRADQQGPVWDKDIDAWTGPFVMAAINSKIVRRSNALLDYAYGRDFRYSEAVITGPGLAGRAKALALSLGLGGLVLGASFTPTRKALQRFVLPKPGEGPNENQRENGFFNLRLIGRHADGWQLRAVVTADRDPGYGATSGMLAEAAVCLAQDISHDDVAGGFWTPASAMGTHLIERLRERAGMRFEITDG